MAFKQMSFRRAWKGRDYWTPPPESDSVGWGLRVYRSNKLSGDANDSGLGISF